jgi:uncharacterized RDD family membrane protein YckC
VQDPINPYAPPETDTRPAPTADDDDDDLDVMDASAGARFANLLIDLVCRMVFAYVLAFALAMTGVRMAGLEGIVFGLGSMLLYYVGFETLFGRTPGKLITGTRVVRMDGRPLTFLDVLKRTLCRFVPFEPFSFLSDARGWHDRWSDTRVVSVRR